MVCMYLIPLDFIQTTCRLLNEEASASKLIENLAGRESVEILYIILEPTCPGFLGITKVMFRPLGRVVIGQVILQIKLCNKFSACLQTQKPTGRSSRKHLGADMLKHVHR